MTTPSPTVFDSADRRTLGRWFAEQSLALPEEREDRFVPNQLPAGTTILPIGIAEPAAGVALTAKNSR